ncbi:MAG: metallophosphoesterase [Kiritimatiellia bacterium]
MHRFGTMLVGGGMAALAWAAPAWGQAYRTPARASWTEDPATAATILWDRPEAGRGTVRYGTTTNYSRLERDGGGLHRHAIALRDLQPGTRYFYEASSPDGYCQPGTFRTAPAAGAPLHFAVHGDLQGGLDVFWAQEVADCIVREDPQWILHMGDMCDEAYTAEGFSTWTNFFQICSQELAQAVFMPLLGNHDDPGNATVPNHERGLYHRLFALPEPAPGRGYYAFTAGNVRFLFLNSDDLDAVQTNWLAGELQAAANDTNVTWLVAACHRPPYSQGEREGWDEGKANWCPLLVKYEADWMFNGHSHNYQRTVPVRGVRYLVSGGGGGYLYGSAVGEPLHAFATTCYHHVSCHVTGDVMQVRAIRSDGLVFDSETVTNRRQVRVEPAFPLRGQTARILYRATEGPLAAADPVYVHLGQDVFTNAFADTPMTWDAARQRWTYEFTVPATATQRVAFAFHDAAGANWHNNYAYNWQALLGRVDMEPSPPAAGSNAALRYEADLGPLAGATQVTAWVSFNGGRFPATNPVPLANVSGARWEGAFAVPAHAADLAVVFTANSGRDDNDRRTWIFPVAGATARAWPPAPVVDLGSPVITGNPTGTPPNNVGDNFDLLAAGPPLAARDAALGFGDFGQIWLNADETNLYVGGYGLDLGGSNNVPILFLGVDTLTDDAWNLEHKTGLPNALDILHNVRFIEPMDVALVLGNQYGDGPGYTNFTYGGCDFGQGVYYLGTNSGVFAPLATAQLSQFDGEDSTPCPTGGDGSSPETTRWEAALPWTALGAAGPEAVAHLFLCGVIASDGVSANDRYLSRTVLGDRAWGARDGYGQYAYGTVTMGPLRVNLLHADLRGDGIPNEWRQTHFGTPDGPPADEDTDGDGFDNRAEEIAGTHPADSASFFALDGACAADGSWTLRWSPVADRFYDLYFSPDLFQPFAPLVAGLASNAFAPDSNGFYRLLVRK